MKTLPSTVSTVENILTMGVNQTLFSVIFGSNNKYLADASDRAV